MRKPKRMFKGREPVATVRAKRYDPNDVSFIAFHEAGHAVSAIVLGMDLKSVDIKVRALPNGMTSVGFTDSGRVAVEDITGKGVDVVMPHLVHSMAGPFAEASINERASEFSGHHGDVEDAKRLAAFSLCEFVETEEGMQITIEELKKNETQLNSLIHSAVQSAIQLVEANWRAIVRVADLLVERKELTGAEVAAIVNAG